MAARGAGVTVVSCDEAGNPVGPPFRAAVAVTPSDVTVFPESRALLVNGAGNVAVRMAGSQNVLTIASVAAGARIDFAVDKVMSTNTTATLIYRLN